MKYALKRILAVLVLIIMGTSVLPADELDEMENRFENFVRCEINRSLSKMYFGEEGYEIEYIRLYSVSPEGNIRVVKGVASCNVNHKRIKLYLAAGLTKLIGREEVSYFFSAREDFRILATGLMKFPYTGDCGWHEFALN